MRVIRIATRESPLALWQAEHVASLLAGRGHRATLVPMAASGDVDPGPIRGHTNIGVFTRTIQAAVLDGRADVAVHSLKDLPTTAVAGMRLAAVPRRGPHRDVLVHRTATTFADLPPGSVIGTGSVRRVAQITGRYPSLVCKPIRGNIQTRLRKMDEGLYDALVLAEAGLSRVDDPARRVPIDPAVVLPAPGQGALAVEVRGDDPELLDVIEQIDDPPTRLAVEAERGLLRRLEGGCLAPIAALAILTTTDSSSEIRLTGRVLSRDGRQSLENVNAVSIDHQMSIERAREKAAESGERLADTLIASGAEALIADQR